MPTHLTYTVREVAPYINWIYYFHAWGMEPRFAAIAEVHNCPSCRASWVAAFPADEQAKAREAMKLYDEAMEQLRQWADEPMCHALHLLAHAYSEGDDIVVGGKVRIPFLRQQHVGKAGYTLCLSDFIKAKNEDEDEDENQPSEDSLLSVVCCPLTLNPQPSTLNPKQKHDIANTIGLFATTINLPLTKDDHTSTYHVEAPPFRGDGREVSLQLSTLADRLAEATAEKMHEEVRKHYWGYAQNENLTMRELHNEQFQGIRPAVGYPSLPDQSINFILDDLLHFEEIGITLSENGAMHPHSSVSGFMFAHPKARYFAVGNISEEQLADYAQRRGLSIEQTKMYLACLF